MNKTHRTALRPVAVAALAAAACNGVAWAQCGGIAPGEHGSVNCTNPGDGSVTINAPTTITLPDTQAAIDGVHVEVTGASGSASAVVNGAAITNNNIPGGGGQAAGIYLLVSLNNSAATGSASLTLSGNNRITVYRGGGTLVNVFGSGSGTTTITGFFSVDNRSVNSGNDEAVEITVRGGSATLDMQSTGTLSVKAGNGILVQSTVGDSALRASIGSGVTILLDNTDSGSGGSIFSNAGIKTSTSANGTTELATAATIHTTGNHADGIHSITRFSGSKLHNSGPITTAGTISHGIEALGTTENRQGGSVTLGNSGAISTAGGGSAADASHGILAFTTTEGTGRSGDVNVSNSGTVSTSGAFSDAIQAKAIRDVAQGGTGDTGTVSVNNAGAATATGQNANGIQVLSEAGTVQVVNTAPGQASGGAAGGAGVAMGGTSQTLANSGRIGALSDRAVAVDVAGYATGTVLISNAAGGQVTGGIFATSSSATLNNAGAWNLRNFADLDGDGRRETLAVAKSDFGSAAGNTVNNTGTIALFTHDGSASVLNATSQYLPLANPNNAMALHSPTQGQILGVAAFNHSGILDLTANPSAGDVLLITGGHAPGTDGGGVFTANGGLLKLNAVLNQGGGNNSMADVLVLDATRRGTAPTAIEVTGVGGAGAQTAGDGIALVEVLNKAASATDAFTLASAVVAGPHEYLLYQGGSPVNGGDPADGNWYLRSEVVVPSPTPTPSGFVARLLFRPEIGAYLSNRRQASGMFVHSLHDRAGELQGGEGQSADTQDGARRPGWIRISGKDTDAAAPGGLFSVNSRSTLVQGGGDIIRRPAGGDGGRLHLGAMLGYGKTTGDAHTQFNPRQAHGKVEGWNAGVYGTWYQNGAGKPGAYADAWAGYSAFNNSVRGDTLPEVKYRAAAYTVSGEAGYAIRLGAGDWLVEPQAQLVYVRYDEDDITEPNGTRISGHDGSGWISRLGVRTYRNWVRESGRTLQPYLTLNWWQDSVGNELSFNTVALKDIHPGKRYEVKAGLNASLAPGWTAWGDLGYQWGEQGYRSTSVRVGTKFSW